MTCVKKCKTAESFLNELSLTNKNWYEKSDRKCNWIFRGQNNSAYDLIPSIHRNLICLNKFDEIMGDSIPGVPMLGVAISNMIAGTSIQSKFKDRLELIIKNAFIEIKLIDEFLMRANSIGLVVPTLNLFPKQYNEINSVDYFYGVLHEYINNFIYIDKEQTSLRENFHPNGNNAFPYIPLVEYFFPQATALAQHHGILTRYLDWTTDPLIAAFFSIRGVNSSATQQNICVWALNTKYLRYGTLKGEVKLHKRLQRVGLEFLHKQKGLFTEMVGAESYYYHNAKWPNLEQYLQASNYYEGGLVKIELPKSKATDVAHILNNMGVNEYSLMPTYDKVAQSIVLLP